MTRPVETIAITGATGFVGKTTVDLALSSGFQVRALTRRDQPEKEGITWIKGALDDQASLKSLCEGADVVLHIAGVVNAPDAAGFEAGNVTGTLAVVEAAKAASVSRFIHTSSLSAREPQLSIYGQSKERAEKIVASSGLDWTIIRPPAIYGPGDGEMLDLFKMAKRGFVLLPPNGRISLLHVQDLARLFLALLPENEDCTAQVFEADDGAQNGWTHKGFGWAIGWAVGKRVSTISAPRRVLELASKGDKLFRGKKAKLTADRVGYLCHDDWVISESARPPETLWKPLIGTRQGLKETAKWYRDHKWL